MKPTISELEIFNKYSESVESLFDLDVEPDDQPLVVTQQVLDNFTDDLRKDCTHKLGPTIAAITHNYFDAIKESDLVSEGIINTYDVIVKLAYEFEYKIYPNESWGDSPNFLKWEDALCDWVTGKL